jgi:hypothetical protein
LDHFNNRQQKQLQLWLICLQVVEFQMMQLLDQVHSGQQQLLQLWQVKRVRLDQCLQLRMFEQDCEKVSSRFFFPRAEFH